MFPIEWFWRKKFLNQTYYLLGKKLQGNLVFERLWRALEIDTLCN